MATFHERKAARAEHFRDFVSGWKERACTACSGSGRHDAAGAPACGGCGGVGREKVAPAVPPPPNHFRRPMGETSAEQRILDLAYFAQPGIAIPKHRPDLEWLRVPVAELRALRRSEAEAAWAARRAPAMRP